MFGKNSDYVENDWRRKKNPPELYFREYNNNKYVLNNSGRVLGDIKNGSFRYPYEKTISGIDFNSMERPYTRYQRVSGMYYMSDVDMKYKNGKSPDFFFKEEKSYSKKKDRLI